MITSERNASSNPFEKVQAGGQTVNLAPQVSREIKMSNEPSISEMNELAMTFNSGRVLESMQLATRFTEIFPNHGYGWKVLGATLQKEDMLDDASVALQKAAKLLPKDAEVQYNLGNYYYDLQLFTKAILSYRKAIKLRPDFSQAYFNLGNVFKKQGLLKKAETNYLAALKTDSKNIHILCNLAQVLYEQGKYGAAKVRYEAALNIQPDFTDAHLGLGAIYRASHEHKNAEKCFRAAIQLNHNDINAHNNLGDLLKALGRFLEAETCYQAALIIAPESAETTIKLGLLMKAQGRLNEAVTFLTKAISINPECKEVQNDLGLARAEQGMFLEAEHCYKKALEIDPDYWVTHNNLGLTLHSMGRFPEAESSFEKAIELNPTQALVYSNLSLPLAAQGKIKKAETSLKKAVALAPEYVNAYINLCTNYLAQGYAHKAEEACLKALQLQPDSIKAKSNLLFTMNYSEGHSIDYRLEQAREYEHIVAACSVNKYSSWNHESRVNRLRIGLVSGDLRQHPVAYFLENWVKHLDASQFELIAYPTDNREDAVTARLKPHFSGWKSLVGLSDQAAAELIHNDGVHILMDLSGHTAENRLPIFSMKPAPIQVSWLGYFATTGMTSMDYLIADEVGVPEQNKAQFVEQIKYMPDTRLCFTAPDTNLEVSALPALTNGYITFGSFQTMVKASDEVLALWAEVMNALPTSKLRWQCKSFGDAAIADNLRHRLAQYGIEPNRLILLGSVSRDQYLRVHAEVDMVLDTFPYPGGTTTCEALWVGVPTLTLAGNTLIARQGASLLTAAGLSHWVAKDISDYVSKAVSFASNINDLAKLRSQLRAQVIASPLFDATRFSKNMEKILWEMWNDNLPLSAKQIPSTLDQNLVSSESNNEQYSQGIACDLLIISATKYSESEFWTQSALGLSLHRHLKQESRFKVKITFDSMRSLPEVFNEVIEQAEEDAVLIFTRDDVWLDEANLADKVLDGLTHFDVVGVAGNRRRLPNQPSWAFLDSQFNWDNSENLSGRIARGAQAFGEVEFFGESPAKCELLDGVFLATKKSTLIENELRFDGQFSHDFYDMDFCRSASAAGLKLGTWLINLTQQRTTIIGNAQWREKYQDYLNKWEQKLEMKNSTDAVKSNSDSQELQNVICEVFQMALDHQNAGQLEQAEQLYQEILNIQPLHAEANHNLGSLEAHSKSAVMALPRLELAVQNEPSNEQFWVTYIEVLINSGAIETAVDALELGQKFGLGETTAQGIAEKFVSNFESRAIEVLVTNENQESEDLSLTINKLDQDAPIKFLIVAPYYTDKSAGIVVLHELCSSLNILGHQAAMILTGSGQYTIFNDESCYGPSLQRYKLKDKSEFNEFIRDGIVIYPEIETGNPLGGARIVRYLLNREGFVANNSINASEKDFILSFSNLYHEAPDAYLIKLPLSPIFNVENTIDSLDRTLDVTYIGKGHKYSQCFVIPNTLEVNRQWPSNKRELAILFKNTRYFYTWDTVSQTNIDALFCGAIPVFMNPAPFKSFDELENEIGKFPMATATINNAEVFINISDDFTASLNRFKANYIELVNSYESRLVAVVDKIYQHFSSE
jgi:protein O-GlcNAc transferase